MPHPRYIEKLATAHVCVVAFFYVINISPWALRDRGKLIYNIIMCKLLYFFVYLIMISHTFLLTLQVLSIKHF